jgi:CRP/FNR family transcriptional regulator, cyclic AMP receptor protein
VLDMTVVQAFKTLQADTIETLAKGSSLVNCADRARIFGHGDRADHVYAIVGGTGRVRISSADESGKTFMIEVFGCGELFGEIAVIDGGPRTADAVADGSLTLLCIRATVFLHALEIAPGLGAAISRLLAARLRRTFLLLEAVTFETVELRLARQLLYLGEREGRILSGGMRLRGRYRQGDLADLLGVSTRSIITVLNAWRERGVVAYDAATARITILDHAALLDVVDRHRSSPEI